ncbi:hypothetical protein BD311DRAFT_442841 [Dichomitus squalens]|uniref:Uncharacterized protein n=1 Tax=Dichomitus squalens TaxID=114155 RepID=A0A4Q9N2Y2_9APHY|nr:hypothetical protein BD311DRAFT_442841 [Dichomitus squalens]
MVRQRGCRSVAARTRTITVPGPRLQRFERPLTLAHSRPFHFRVACQGLLTSYSCGTTTERCSCATGMVASDSDFNFSFDANCDRSPKGPCHARGCSGRRMSKMLRVFYRWRGALPGSTSPRRIFGSRWPWRTRGGGRRMRTLRGSRGTAGAFATYAHGRVSVWLCSDGRSGGHARTQCPCHCHDARPHPTRASVLQRAALWASS